MNGIVNFYKPKGMTSHDAVNYFRRLFGIKKIGHTGTLDPNVVGVLPICIGKATRMSEYVLEVDKEYVGELSLGLETDTQDSDGKVVNQSKKTVKKEEIISVFNKYIGEIEQIPPMYSAVKHKGKKLYELAREGKTVKRNPRKSYIYKLDIWNIEDNKKVLFYIKCSKGTYIRTICHDIGRDLNTYGYMSHLIRVGVGDFKIENSLSMDYLNKLDNESLKEILLPMDLAAPNLRKVTIEGKLYNKLTNGMKIDMTNYPSLKIDERYRIYCRDQFIGIGRIIIKDDFKKLKMDKVLI